MRDDNRVQGSDELDSRIDAALRSYAEPPHGTEPRIVLARILEQAQMERPSRPVRWWIWGVAGAAACLVAAMVALWVVRAPRVPEIAKVPQPPAVRVPDHPVHPAIAEVKVPAVRHATHSEHSVPRREEARATPLPKLDVFPTPQPLTPEEQALVSFAKQGPPAVQRAVLADQKQWDEITAIASLQMPPQAPTQQDK